MIKRNGKFSIVTGFVSFISALSFVYYLFIYKETDYYACIDNTDVHRLFSKGDMIYEYHLVCYNNEGKPKKIKLKTKRKLKDNTYIQLKYKMIHGVKVWWEVQFCDLPVQMQEKWKLLY